MKALKIAGIAVAAVVALVVIAAGILIATFDAAKYKGELVRLVKERTGRNLVIAGDLSLSLFPSVSVVVGKASLSEPGSDKPFAQLDEARVSVAVMPLFTGRVAADRVVLAGLRADVVRFKDGRSNIDDLMGAPAAAKDGAAKSAKADKDARPAVAPLAIDVAGITVHAASLGYRDERDGTRLRASIDELSTGRIASDAPGRLALKARLQGEQPKADLALDLQTGYRLDFASGAAALSGLALKASGDAPGVAGLSASLKGDIEADPAATRYSAQGVELAVNTRDGIEARLSAPRLRLEKGAASGEAVNGALKLARPGLALDARFALAALSARGDVVSFPGFSVEFSGRQGADGAQNSFSGRITTPVTLDLAARAVRLAKIAGELAGSGPGLPPGGLKAAISGSAGAEWARQTARGDLAVRHDDGTLNAKFAVSRFAPLAARFDVAADRLNVDRFVPPAPAMAQGGAGKSGGAAKPGTGAPADAPIDLSALKGPDVAGTLKIDQLTARKLKAANVNVTMKLAGGRLDVAPLAADLYGGRLAGQVSANAAGNRVALRSQLAGVEIGPLLRDLTEKDLIEGKGNVNLDLTGGGATVSALKKSLAGSASLALKDGAVKGINLAESIRKLRSLGGAQEQGASRGEKTDFSELSASFVVMDGVARNDDLVARSPLLRLSGAGSIDIGNDAMDYVARTTVAATMTGQGGKDNVAGLTVPVRISGPFDALKYRLDFSAAASEAVREAARQKTEEVREKAGDAVRDRLKGLLRR